MRSAVPALLLAAATGLVAACGKSPAPPAAAPVPAAGAPTAAEAAAATYRGIEEAGTDVTLVDGQWEGKPFKEGAVTRPAVGLADDRVLQGDLDGDGTDETVVMLWSGSGGSGTRSHLAVLDRVDGRVDNIATRLLGDRVQLRHIALDGGVVRLDVVAAGPGDAACCPGELTSLAWRLGQGGLEDAEPPLVSGRLELAALEGSHWRLAKLAWSEPAPAAPVVTLAWTGDRFAGNAGCNDYSAGARDDGPAPGDITIDPPVATRKMCSPAEMEVEDRFLAQLGGVRKFGFMNGRLMLLHGDGDMLFDPAEANPAD